jgi:hypothetical protein
MIQGREANVYKYIYEFIYVRIYIMKPTSCEFSVAQAYCGSKCRSCYGYSISSTADVVTIHTELLTSYENALFGTIFGVCTHVSTRPADDTRV